MAVDWITTADAAVLSGFHVNHIRRLARKGLIQARRFGPALQIDRASLQAYLAEGEDVQDQRRGAKPAKHSVPRAKS